MKGNKKGLVLFLLLALAMCTACSEATQNTSSQPQTAKSAVSNTVDAFGVIKAQVRNIAIDFPAKVDRIITKVGEKVKKGDPLIALDIGDFTQQISEKEKELKIANIDSVKAKDSKPIEEKALERMKSEFAVKKQQYDNHTDPDIQKLLGDIKLAEDALAKAKKDLATKQELKSAGAFSESEIEDLAVSVNEKQKSLEGLKLSLDSLKNTKKRDLDQLQESIDQKSLSLKSFGATESLKVSMLENDLKLMKEKLNKTYMKKNEVICNVNNGLVYEIGNVEGDTIAVGAKLISIMDMDSMNINANVPEEFIRNVKEGALVTIIPVADKSRQYKGKVTKIYSVAKALNGETIIPIDVSIDQNDGFLLPDYNVDIKIDYK